VKLEVRVWATPGHPRGVGRLTFLGQLLVHFLSCSLAYLHIVRYLWTNKWWWRWWVSYVQSFANHVHVVLLMLYTDGKSKRPLPDRTADQICQICQVELQLRTESRAILVWKLTNYLERQSLYEMRGSQWNRQHSHLFLLHFWFTECKS